jgi:hypothetical protein
MQTQEEIVTSIMNILRVLYSDIYNKFLCYITQLDIDVVYLAKKFLTNRGGLLQGAFYVT